LDEELAASLATTTSGRNRDASGAKNKKAQALAVLRQQRKVSLAENKKDDDEESDIDFGDDDEDSDDDYEAEGFLSKLRQKKTGSSTAAAAASPLDRHKDYDDGESDDDRMAKTRQRDSSGGGGGGGAVVEATLEDYIQITLPRRRLARWCHEPFFNQAVIGCFARVFIGPDKATGEKMYRLCEIVDVTKGKKEYKFPAVPNEKPVSSKKILHLRFGTNTREFPMYLISDSRPNEEDVTKFVTMEKTNRQTTVMSRSKAGRIRKRQDALVNNYTYTKEDIEFNVQEGKKSGKALSNLALEQTRAAIGVTGAETELKEAQSRLDEARKKLLEYDGGDRTEEDNLSSAVKIAEQDVGEAEEELEGKIKAQKAVHDIVNGRKTNLSKRTKDQNWAKVNQRAKQMNKDADFEAYKAQKAQEEREATHGVAKFNPYARRKVKPKILWEVGQKEEKKDDEPSGSKDREARDETLPGNGPDAVKAAQAVQEAQKAAQITQSHQFAFDEEDPGALSFSLKSKRHRALRVRKGLSLADYQSQKLAGVV
jgi:RNA polymerase-associated protein RTF1